MPRFMVDSNWYGWDGPENVTNRVKNRCLALSLANAVISFTCGVVSTGVTRHNWVGFAATAALIALMMEIIGAVRFRRAPHVTDKRTFDSIHQMMRWSAQCHMILMALAFAAGAVSCFQAFGGIPDLLILSGFAASFACSWFFLRAYSALPTYSIKAPD